MIFLALLYREKEIIKSHFLNLFLSYFANFIFIFSLIAIFNSKNQPLSQNNLIIYFLTISQSQLFIYIFNKIDEHEKIFDYFILTFEHQIKFLITRFISILLLNTAFLSIIIIGLNRFYFESATFNINSIYILFISLAIIISNTVTIFITIFSNHRKSLSNFTLILLIPLNLPAIIFFANRNYNLIYLSLIIAIVNLAISTFFNKLK